MVLRRLVLVVVLLGLLGVTNAHGGDWHQSAQLVCSNCHTMHYSEGGMLPMNAEAGGPFSQLLLASTVNALCLICHDGTDPDAPDVLAPVSYTADPAGGYFSNSGGVASDTAHNLGMPTPETPPGSSDSLILSCTSCHNPHGSANYRNLWPNPAGSGNTADVTVTATQTKTADGPGGNTPAQVYVPSNIVYRSGMSAWCQDCHPNFHGAAETGDPEPWFRHPQDLSIIGRTFADYTNWSGTITNRVEVQSPSDTLVPSADDQVFCLTCHKAHGSANKYSTVYADGSRMVSTCQQCHNKPYELTKHANVASGVQRLLPLPKGDCTQCHDEHASRDGTTTAGGPHDLLLFSANDNALCYTNNGAGPCHTAAGANKIFQGPTVYDSSSHATDTAMVWPGTNPPARPSSDYGKCLNCHNPHGYTDGSGLIPAQAVAREENLCLTCHDGSTASDIQTAITQTYRHPTGDYTSRHSESEDGTAANYGNTNRHAECSDCHNPHYAKADTTSPTAPNASERNRGISGVSVINGAAGSQPAYSYIDPNIGVTYEYQFCFKCHSSWTTQPAGQPDMATLFNTNNPGYHPVEAQGKNTNIDPRAFVNGWAPTDTMYCSDCHTSDNPSVRGPHGSQYNYILKNDYVKSSAFRRMSSNEICFQCHLYDTYANRMAPKSVKRYSRFDKHSKHVDDKRIPCYTCHDSHGSTDLPHLIVTGRVPGVVQYIEGPVTSYCAGTSGGCHTKLEDYDVSYPR